MMTTPIAQSTRSVISTVGALAEWQTETWLLLKPGRAVQSDCQRANGRATASKITTMAVQTMSARVVPRNCRKMPATAGSVRAGPAGMIPYTYKARAHRWNGRPHGTRR